MTRPHKAVGVFTTDRSLVVQTWDAWMAEATGVVESVACGEPLERLYPELAERGLLSRLRRVADGSGIEVLAPALHKYLIPCPPRDRSSRFERMRQHVILAPLRNHDGIAGVIVTIKDVTARFDRDRRLAGELDSPDESVRLRAATELATEGEAPSLLTNALTDQSWRVRRVAAEGMAAGGGHEVVETLVEALRDHHRNSALLNAAMTALAQTREDVVLEIVALLAHEDAEVRTYAALTLGLIDDARAVPELIDRLGDADVNVCFHAIEALGRIGDRRAAEPIAAIAIAGDFFLAFAALDALAAIGEPSVATKLLPLLDDPLLLPAAAACLGAIGSEEMASVLAQVMLRPGAPVGPIAVALADLDRRMDTALGETGVVGDLARAVMTAESSHALLAAILGASDDELRGLAIVLSWLPFDGIDQALAQLLRHEKIREVVADRFAARGATAAPYIEEVARDEMSDVARAAAVALGQIGSPRSVPTLVAMLGEESDPSVVSAAAGALGAIGDRRAFKPLLALMDHPDATVRQAAVAALSSIGDPKMEAAISGRLRDASPRVREAAARVAGYFGYESCLRWMVELCDDADPMVRRATVEALANYDQRSAWSKIHEIVSTDTDATVRAAGVRALAHSRTEESLRVLVSALRDPGPWVRYYAARASARRGAAHADILTALVECAIRDQAVPVRIAAIEALGALGLGAASMTSVVVALARDGDPDVSCAAVAALGHVDASRAAAALMFHLDGDDPRHQYAALDALGVQGSSAGYAVAAIGALARDTRDEELRRHAVRTLGEIGDAAAIRELGVLGTNRRFTELVIGALAGLDDGRLPMMQRELADGGEEVREVIVMAVGRMKHASAGPLLAVALEDPSARVRFAAARGLSRLDLRDARTQLAALARTDESPAVRVAAQDALVRS